MSSPRIDDETLAAFLDARLSAEEHARVSQAIADDPELYEQFLEAAHLIADLEAESEPIEIPTPPTGVHKSGDASPEAPPALKLEPGSPAAEPPSASRKPNWRKRLIVAVPLLAAAALVGIMVNSRGAGAVDTIALMQSTQLASATGPGSVRSSLGESWDQPGWSVVRGGESGSASPGTVARLGARLAQLEYSASAGDSIAYEQSRSRVRSLLSTIEGSGPLAAGLATIAMTAASDRATLARQIREVSGNPTVFDVGAWLETTRLALRSGRDDFLAPERDARATLQHLTEDLGRAPPEGPWIEIQRHLLNIQRDGAIAASAGAQVDSALAAIPR